MDQPAVGSSLALECELHLLNDCLADAMSLHLFLCRSMRSTGSSLNCALFMEDVQEYLRQVLEKYSGNASLRRKLRSSRCLYYLQCLTDPDTREEFVHVASHPAYAAAS